MPFGPGGQNAGMPRASEDDPPLPTADQFSNDFESHAPELAGASVKKKSDEVSKSEMGGSDCVDQVSAACELLEGDLWEAKEKTESDAADAIQEANIDDKRRVFYVFLTRGG